MVSLKFYSFEEIFKMRKIIKLFLKVIPRPILIKMSMLMSRPVSYFYAGNAVECTICGKTFRKYG